MTHARRLTTLLVAAITLVTIPTAMWAQAAAKTRKATTTTVASTAPARLPVSALKIMNYYPADAGWTYMWTAYSHERTVSDFTDIASLGANTVRIIVAPQAVGYPSVAPAMLGEFSDMLSVAKSAGLSVQLTLFDWWSSYTDITGSQQWLQSLLAGQSGNPTIALVELQNELPTTNASAMTWAATMLPTLSQLLPGVPRTLSASGASGPVGITALETGLDPSLLDVVNVHYYGDAAGALNAIRTAQANAGVRPVIVGETGLSTTDGAAGEEAQARLFRVLGRITQSLHIPAAAPWILSDFASGAIPGSPSAAQYTYGLRRTDRTWKPAAAAVKAAFAGIPSSDIDGGFEREANGGTNRFGAWSAFDPADGVATVAHDLVHSGANAICFAATGGTASAVPSVQQSFPVLQAGEIVSASAYVARLAATGNERVALAWYDAAGHYLGQNQSTAASAQGSWQQLSISAAAPVGASVVQVHLKAANESGRACYDDATVTW